MDRRVSVAVATLAALVASAGCQGYNFNPVGHCVIQPGTRRVTITDISTADVLFVVDDSGSMGDEQTAIQTNFTSFMNVLVAANQERLAVTPEPLQAIDFHLAVTSTANYYNEAPAYGSVCSSSCPNATGQVSCLKNSLGALKGVQPPRCQADSDCDTAAGYACRSDCLNGGDVYYKACCLPTAPRQAQPIACSSPGADCGNFDPFYYWDGTCDMGYVDDAAPVSVIGPTNYRYPGGKFMSFGTNAKVLQFTKGLNWAGGAADPTIKPLVDAFTQNVKVGTCGSPQEQGLEAARRAIKGVLGQDGLSQPIAAGEFLHPKSKLVVVWVTDEDDCSAPYSAADGVVYQLVSGCMRDPDGDGYYTDPDPREYDAAQYADFFTTLDRPFGAAFIAESPIGCTDQGCTGQVCCSGAGCSGQERVPTRYLDLAAQLRSRSADVVVGSICDSFGTTLGRIAEIVKPPSGLTLPTMPAAGEVTILRIARPDGTTRKTCYGPASPLTYPTKAAAEAAGYDWWFVADTGQTDPAGVSSYVFINHATGNCEANPGETYSADYIGRLPAGGCTSQAACATALGGQPDDWTCYAGVDVSGNCIQGSPGSPPTIPAVVGTCICGSPANNKCL